MKFKVQKNNLRLDLFLKEAAQSSRKQVKRWIDEGRVSVNDRKVIIASWAVEKGDTISLRDEQDSTAPSEAAKNYFLKVIWEDEFLLVVEKDAGVPSEASPLSLKPPLPEIVYHYLKRAHPELTHPYLLKLHRLDRETSGLMVYGKRKEALPLLEDFKKHQIGRRYTALVEGKIEKNQGRIDVPLVKNPEARGKKMRVAVGKEGKEAVTEYRVLQRFPHHTLLEVTLKTGRTHQVRAHMAHLGRPIVGDPLYGKKTARKEAPRMALHASELGFIHPVTQKKLKFHSKPPKEFRGLIEQKIKGV